MEHLIEKMAHAGHTPWHQLGHHSPKQPIEVWARKVGMDYRMNEPSRKCRRYTRARAAVIKPRALDHALALTA